MCDNKIAYLQLVQEPICRMSTISAVLKGFSATIVAEILIFYDDINNWILLLSYVLIASFALLDIYYLSLERKLRYLYEQIRLEKREIDFSMQIINSKSDGKSELKKAKARVWDCIKSPTIYLFYIPMIIIGIIIIFLNLQGGI